MALGFLDDPEASPIERAAMRRVVRRLIPLLMVCTFIGYLDRVNVGFAELTMKGDLNSTETVFGLRSGIFLSVISPSTEGLKI